MWLVRARLGRLCLRELDASVGASGPHDFAVRSNISRPRAVDRSQIFRFALRSHRAQNAAASTASHPAFRDDHDTPLFRGGMRKVLDVIWGGRKRKYFFKRDSTQNCPTGKSPRRREPPSCPGRGAASFTLLRRAGTHVDTGGGPRISSAPP